MDDKQKRVEKYITKGTGLQKNKETIFEQQKKALEKAAKKDEKMVFKQRIIYEDFCKTVICAANWQEERLEAA